MLIKLFLVLFIIIQWLVAQNKEPFPSTFTTINVNRKEAMDLNFPITSRIRTFSLDFTSFKNLQPII